MDATAQEGSFQRVLAVHSAAAEAGGLAAGIEARKHRAIGIEALAVEVGLQTAERLAGEELQAHRDKRAFGFIEDAVRGSHADELVAEKAAGYANVVDLGVLAKGVIQLRIPVL